MISTAVDADESSSISAIEIVYDPTEADQIIQASSIAKQCEFLDCPPVHMVSLKEALEGQTTDETLRVFIAELQRPLLMDIRRELFEQIQTIISSTLRALWITQGGGILPTKPHFRLAEGLLRVLMEEDGRRKLHVLSLESLEGLAEAPQAIGKLLQFLCSGAAKDADTEYLEQGGILHIPRVVTPSQLNEVMSQKASKQQQKLQNFDCQVPLQLDATSPGLISGFNFIEDFSAHQPLKANEIEVKVKCGWSQLPRCLDCSWPIEGESHRIRMLRCCQSGR